MDLTWMSTSIITTDSLTEATQAIEDDSPHEVVKLVFECLFYVVGGCGVISNILVLAFLYDLTSSHRALVLIINQCIIDLFSSASFLLTYAVVFHEKDTYYGLEGKVYCHFLWSESLLYVGLQASVFNMVAMSSERLLVIVYPLRHHKTFTRTKAYCVAVVVWILGILVNIPTIMMSSLDKLNHNCDFGLLMSSTKVTLAYGALDLAYSYFIPLAVLMYSYILMLVTLRKRTRDQYSLSVLASISLSTKPSPHLPQHSDRTKLSLAQMTLFKMMAMLTICFLLCWTPTQTYFFAYILGQPLSFDGAPYYSSLVLTLLNSSLNPIIYVCVNRTLRKQIIHAFTCSTSFIPNQGLLEN